jgi:hypothetical protein
MAKCLIVGINDYCGENDLQGCVNDVRDVANTLSVINPEQRNLITTKQRIHKIIFQ